jgi:hypothetical protein
MRLAGGIRFGPRPAGRPGSRHPRTARSARRSSPRASPTTSARSSTTPPPAADPRLCCSPAGRGGSCGATTSSRSGSAPPTPPAGPEPHAYSAPAATGRPTRAGAGPAPPNGHRMTCATSPPAGCSSTLASTPPSSPTSSVTPIQPSPSAATSACAATPTPPPWRSPTGGSGPPPLPHPPTRQHTRADAGSVGRPRSCHHRTLKRPARYASKSLADGPGPCDPDHRICDLAAAPMAVRVRATETARLADRAVVMCAPNGTIGHCRLGRFAGVLRPTDPRSGAIGTAGFTASLRSLYGRIDHGADPVSVDRVGGGWSALARSPIRRRQRPGHTQDPRPILRSCVGAAVERPGGWIGRADARSAGSRSTRSPR